MVSTAISIVAGTTLGIVAVAAQRTWGRQHRVWLAIFYVLILSVMTAWAWDTNNHDFPATFGPFCVVMATSHQSKRRRLP